MDKMHLREKLRDIHFLKEEYLVGSADAFFYLRRQEQYHDLRNFLREYVKEQRIPCFSLRELAQLCEVVREVVQKDVKYVMDSDTLKTGRRHKNVVIRHILEDAPDFVVQKSEREHLFLDFDYRRFLVHYLKGADSQEWFDIFHAEEILNSGKGFFYSDSPEFVLGRRYAFKDLVHAEEFLHKGKVDSPDKPFPSRKTLALHIEQIEYIADQVMMRDFTYEEKKHLLKGSSIQGGKECLYDRVLQEGVLHHPDMQKRIALTEIILHTSAYQHPRVRIGALACFLQTLPSFFSLFRLEEAIQKASLNGKEWFKAKEVFQEFNEEIPERAEYVLRNLRKHGEWLEEFLKR